MKLTVNHYRSIATSTNSREYSVSRRLLVVRSRMYLLGVISFSTICFSDCLSLTPHGMNPIKSMTTRIAATPYLRSATEEDGETIKTFSPVFDFASPDQKAVDNFERIDDAIMGGISSSSMKQSKDGKFAKWSGICRLDGGYVLIMKGFLSTTMHQPSHRF